MCFDMPSWTNKTRIPSESDQEEILTPDSDTILVGSSEDEVLIYQAAVSLWTLKSLISGSWSNQQKILYYTYLLTQNGNYIGLQDGSIIGTDQTNNGNWQNKTRESASWQNTQKTQYPEYILSQDGSYIALQDSSLLYTHLSNTDNWSLKSKII